MGQTTATLEELNALARMPSGVIVPAALANEPQKGAAVARDMDGRRRIVYTDDERKTIDKAITLFRMRGAGVIVGCVGKYGKPGDQKHEDGSPACGQPMVPEAVGTEDAGYGCACTRIHFRRDHGRMVRAR